MRLTKLAALAAVSALCLLLAARTAYAVETPADLKSWPASPAAYFLTHEERALWGKASTDAERRDLFDRYWSERAPDLEQKLTERIAVADKYFSSGKTRGSETLRGKVIILFGPPSELRQSDGSGAMGGPDADRASVGASGVADPHSNVGPGVRGLSRSATDPTFTIIYDETHAPKEIGKAFRVELRMKSAARQEAVDEKSLEERFDVVQQASRVRRPS